jgi:TFIIF-interacting CTD phosphatase-like protein
VALRPYLFSFLKKIKQYFELVIFTSLQSTTATQILEEIDPEQRLIADWLTREHCLALKGDLLCKDIRIVNRSSKEMCLIDCNPEAALLQPENCIPILPFREGEGEERELMEL